MNHPESMLVTPHTVRPMVSPIILMMETAMRFPVVQRNPPRREGMKKGGMRRIMFTTRPTNQIPIHNIHWKNRPETQTENLTRHKFVK